MHAVIALALAGCLYDAIPGADGGRVYECQATDVDVLELCTNLGREGLEASTGWECWSTSRAWPFVTGCIYRCTGEPGCNARHGCYCPESR